MIFSHALLAVGYSDQSQAFIVRNSWGENWVKCLLIQIKYIIFFFIKGDKGYCYIPYDYITNPDYCFDAWTIRRVATNDFGHDHWDQDDSVDYKQIDNSDNDEFDDSNRAIERLDDDMDPNDCGKNNLMNRLHP